MATLEWIMSSASGWLASLGELSVRAAFVLGAAWIACLLLRRRSAAVRHLVWTLSLAAVVVAPVTLEFAPKVRVPALWRAAVDSAAESAALRSPLAGSTTVEAIAADSTTDHPGVADSADFDVGNKRAGAAAPGDDSSRADVAGRDAKTPASGVAALNSPTAVPPNSRRDFLRLVGALLLAGWLVGCSVFLARIVSGHVRLQRMALRATALRATDLLAGGLELDGSVRFLQSTGETMPMTWGWRRPVVLLPASFEKWDEERRAMTIYHELAHVKRADWLTQTLAQVVRAVYWFHPLVWAALGRMRVEADRACDDSVLRAGVKPSGYAGHLVRAAREFRTAGLRPWLAIAMAHPSSLDKRVDYVLDGKVERAALRRRGRFALALSMAVIALAVPSVDAVGQTEAPAAGPQVMVEPAGSQDTRLRVDASPSEASPAVPVAAPDPVILAPEAEPLLRAQAQQPRPEPQPSEVGELQQRTQEMHRRAQGLHEQMRAARDFAHELQVGSRNRSQPRLSPEALQTASAALRKALSSSDANVRAEAAEALGRLGSPEGANLEALAAALSDSEPRVQKNAVQSLGHLLRLDKEIPGERVVGFLKPALSSPDAGLRREAAEALGRLRRSTAVINAAIQLAADADPQVQREAIESLGRLLRSADAETARSALPVFQRALQHEDPNVRRQTVETLGGLRLLADEVVPLLAEAAEDPDPGVQREAVEALGRISSPRAFYGGPLGGPLGAGRLPDVIDRTIDGVVGGTLDGVMEGVVAGTVEGAIGGAIEGAIANDSQLLGGQLDETDRLLDETGR